MHGVPQLFGRTEALSVAKSVSFEKKNPVSDLKVVLKKC
jgi:hypothetical protein